MNVYMLTVNSQHNYHSCLLRIYIPSRNSGSCVTGGYMECCEDGVCSGEPADCFCDQFCRFLDDCCADIDEICSTEGWSCALLPSNHIYSLISPIT